MKVVYLIAEERFVECNDSYASRLIEQGKAFMADWMREKAETMAAQEPEAMPEPEAVPEPQAAAGANPKPAKRGRKAAK